MTAAIRPIFLAVKNEEIYGYDPLRQNDNTYQCKQNSHQKEFRAWCKGGSRNSRVVLIAHQKVNEYKTLLETPKDKIPHTWQVFDTSSLNNQTLPDLIKQHNINGDANEAKTVHKVFCALTQGVDSKKVYECMFKADSLERILELARTHKVISIPSNQLVPPSQVNIITAPLPTVLPAKSDEDMASTDDDIFYFKDQDRSALTTPMIEDTPDD